MNKYRVKVIAKNKVLNMRSVSEYNINYPSFNEKKIKEHAKLLWINIYTGSFYSSFYYAKQAIKNINLEVNIIKKL